MFLIYLAELLDMLWVCYMRLKFGDLRFISTLTRYRKKGENSWNNILTSY